MSSRATTWTPAARNPGWFAAGLLLRPLQIAMAHPSVLYVAASGVFLFRHPDVDNYYADRIIFCALCFVVAMRVLALREKIPFRAGMSVPMLGLTGLAVLRAARAPFDAPTWSLVASKFIVPFVLFHIAILVFRHASEQRHFEIFVIIALAYLTFTAIAFLVDLRSLIFPRFILDDSLGVHAHRARGPFLQAVANGLSLNVLGILAAVFSDKRRKLVLLLWLALPLAVLATMTRAVWIAFALSAIVLAFRLGERRLRRTCLGLVVAGLLIGLAAGLSNNALKNAVWDRTEERGPVDVRLAVYNAAWAMFQERPFTGWTANGKSAELARRMTGYHLRLYVVHITYLSLLIEFGIPGLILYAILFLNLFRLTRTSPALESNSMTRLRRVWPILLSVYLFNAFFVDMVYQFVIGLMFTVAGMLCASEEAAA